MWENATTANPSWCGWVSGTAAASTTSTYCINDYDYYNLQGYAYATVSPLPKKPARKKPEPEPCTDEELEDFLFGGA